MIRWQPAPTRKPPRGRRIVLPIAAAMALGSLCHTLVPPVLINESPSLPRGLYWRVWGAAPGIGSIVALPQPESGRAYLSRLGLPDEILLIKRVAAAGPDRVCLTDGTLQLPSGQVPVRRTDRRGVALPAWSGCRQLADGELFLLGDTPTSFDSRYFGPVDRAAIAGVYREGPTW